jgi:hypothetical protein
MDLGASFVARPSSRWKWSSLPKVRSTTQGTPVGAVFGLVTGDLRCSCRITRRPRVCETDAIARSAMSVELATATVSDLPQAARRKPTLAGTRPWLIGSEYDAWPLARLRKADLAR